MTGPPRAPVSRFLWVGALGIASGFPLGLVKGAVPVAYGRQGVPLSEVGWLSLVALPWTLKFLWAPLVDRMGSRRAWITGSVAAVGVLLLAYSTLEPTGHVPPAAWALLAGVALASATQDVAIDAYGVEAFRGRDVGPGAAVRVTAYRLGFLLAAGFLVGRAGALGWAGAWRAGAALCLGMALLSLRLPPLPRAPPPTLWEPLRALTRRPGIVALAAFVFLFKAGDYALGAMPQQFLLRERAFTDAQLGDVLAPVQVVAAIAGTVAGGWLTARWGIFRALWVLGLLQAASNLGWTGAALVPGQGASWAAAVVESFCGGLGTAPFVAFLMASCDRGQAATQYALWTALFGLCREAVGSVSGMGVERLGYAGWFSATAVVAAPAFLLLGAVRRSLEEREAAEASAPLDRAE